MKTTKEIQKLEKQRDNSCDTFKKMRLTQKIDKLKRSEIHPQTQPQHTQAEFIIPENAPNYCFIKHGEEILYLGKDKEYAQRIVKCVNNERKINMHDELVKQLQEMIRYSKVLAKNSHATQHLPIQEAEQLLKQAEQK